MKKTWTLFKISEGAPRGLCGGQEQVARKEAEKLQKRRERKQRDNRQAEKKPWCAGCPKATRNDGAGIAWKNPVNQQDDD